MQKITFKIEGMGCGKCEARVNEAVGKVAKGCKVTSSAAKGETEIICDDLNIEEIKCEIEKAGYGVLEVKSEPYGKKGFFGLFKK